VPEPVEPDGEEPDDGEPDSPDGEPIPPLAAPDCVDLVPFSCFMLPVAPALITSTRVAWSMLPVPE